MNALAAAESCVLADDAGLVRRFVAWTPNAYPRERAAAVNALARACLHCELPPHVRAEAEIALTRALDDPEPRVRRALAEAFASAREAPRHIVLALAQDVSEVSLAILAQSPLLGDADLVDGIGYGDAAAQRAIARRPGLRAPVCAALAEIGEPAAVKALLGNLSADLGRAALWRIFERFGADVDMRERIGGRPGIPAALRAAMAAAAAADMTGLAAARRWLEPRRLERAARDGREQAFVAIALKCQGRDLAELVAWLRGAEHLTVGLILRALCCGDASLLTQSLAEMADLPAARAAGFVADPHGQGFAALYARAAMPAHLLPAFRLAAAAVAEAGGASVEVDHALTMKILRAVEARAEPALTPLAAMLWRLATEAARTEAREPVELAPAVEPLALVSLEAPPVLLLNAEPVNENFAPPVTLADADPEPAVAA